jgi:hypothetical protein
MKHAFILLSGILTLALFCVAADAQVGGGAAIVAVDEAAGSTNPKDSGGGSGGKSYSPDSKKRNTKTGSKDGGGRSTRVSRSAKLPSAAPPPAPKPYNGPILGDKYTFLNYEVIDAVRPVHTNSAKKAGARGLVQVEVLIDENGNVLTANARTGNPILWEEAERAALETKFNKPKANGLPARAIGFLVYRFGPPDEADDDQ